MSSKWLRYDTMTLGVLCGRNSIFELWYLSTCFKIATNEKKIGNAKLQREFKMFNAQLYMKCCHNGFEIFLKEDHSNNHRLRVRNEGINQRNLKCLGWMWQTNMIQLNLALGYISWPCLAISLWSNKNAPVFSQDF